MKGKSEDEYYIEVDNLVKIYGKTHAVDGISLRIKKGEIFAFLGPNGAGKTTTVEIIETIRTPTKGKVRVKGMDVSKNINDIKKIIGVLPQEFSSFDKLKVRETLHYYSQLYDKRVDIDNLLKIMNIEEHKDKLYENLSGGLKQRVGVAVAMVNDPEILFLDEPTTGLDPGARHEVWDVISDLKKKGKTIFLTTHYMEEAEELADHIAIIHRGKIIAEGTVDELVDTHGTGLIVTFKGGDSALASMIKDMDYEVEEKKKGDICVNIKGKDDLINLLTELKKRGANYVEVNVRRSNLEEVFLKLTGEKLRGGEEE
jgi:ABC-2 type transport system ATP-binding protein